MNRFLHSIFSDNQQKSESVSLTDYPSSFEPDWTDQKGIILYKKVHYELHSYNCSILTFIFISLGNLSIYKPKLKKSGDAGYRSRYLSHAKRALYHLSYTPLKVSQSNTCYYIMAQNTEILFYVFLQLGINKPGIFADISTNSKGKGTSAEDGTLKTQ